MSKELEAFNKIKDFGPVGYTLEEYNELVGIIEQALKRLEAIDNAKPSEALECLKEIHFFINRSRIDGDKYEQKLQELNTIKQALLKLDFLEDAMDLPTTCFSSFKNRNNDEITVMRKEVYEKYQEQEKMLDIIKKKLLFDDKNLGIFNICDLYKRYYARATRNILTEEEFDLLKRWLEQ